MPDYSKTIIYKIQHQDKPELIYVGHTTNFNKRKWAHKTNYNGGKKSHLKLYNMMRENGGWEEFKMIQLKEFSCNNRREAEIEEDKSMLELKSNLNTYRSFRDQERSKEENIIRCKEWYKDNKEKAIDYNKKYNEDNKEEIKKYRKQWYKDNKERTSKIASDKQKEKVICELCGKELCRGSLYRHNKAKH